MVLVFAATVLLVAVLLVYELWVGSAAIPAFAGVGLSDFQRLESGLGTVRRAAVHLRYRGHFGPGAAHLGAVGRGRGDLPVGTGAGRLSNALTFLVELLAAIPSVIYGLLAIFTLVPLMRSYIEPFLKDTLGSCLSSRDRPSASAISRPA